MKSILEQKYLEIKENIEKAAKKSERKAEDITLVAVTKTVCIDRIEEAFNLGIKHFGENRVQEFLPKYENLPTPTWHLIGNLQTNKVKFIIDKVSLIHSVDSLRLAEEINKRGIQNNTKKDILIELNIAQEDTKHGIAPQDTEQLIERMLNLPNICVKGLMCIAPYVENSDKNRIHFEKMHRIFIDINSKYSHNIDMKFLSMGMSGDYQVAIEEGSNMVRIGTSLFGL